MSAPLFGAAEMRVAIERPHGGAGTMEPMDEALLSRLRGIAPTRLNEPLSRHTTFGIGGPAEALVTARNARELAAAVVAARTAHVPYFILGAGSNILVGDGGVRGVVIANEARGIEGPRELAGEWVLRAESGMPFATLARNLARQGYAGVEWACGIPGTLGGAVVYNAGAYDGCLADVLRSATVLDTDDTERDVRAADLGLRYRSSVFTRGEFAGRVVLAVEITVTPGDAGALVRTVAAYDARRLDAQPRGRNSGSTFKNPPGAQAWELIEHAGLRGHRIGNARFSDKHCNFIENMGGARAADVHALMSEAQRRVRESTGIELEAEVELVGEGFA
ncbi:MAG TPA: UDP-N-acetylmuramate dehydrogenase [Dehalococcoidia bacterium]|nr:UDP-N-acetylmuramate dehydrogenase [Dehalococcoidia bacterium]